MYFIPHVEDERDDVWIADGVLGFNVEAGPIRVMTHVRFELFGADCNVKHFPCTGPSETLLFEALTEQGKSAGR